MPIQTPVRLGLALSGAAARSAFYLGFLEVLKEHNVPVSVIAAQSGASLVAASFACGTMDRLKQDMFSLDWSKLKQLLRRARRGGWYSLEVAEDYIRHHLTRGYNFQEVETKLCFSATNLETGKLVPLAMGDIAHSVRITCSVPGLFEPVRWGNQVLVDGGVLSVLPTSLAREAGADVIVGVSVRSTKHVFLPSQIRLKRFYNGKRDLLRTPLVRLGKYWRKVVSPEGVESYLETGLEDEQQSTYSMLKVISRSLDLAVDVTTAESIHEDKYSCDLFIQEGEGKYGDSVNLNKTRELYYAGRSAAEENVEAIQNLIRAKQ